MVLYDKKNYAFHVNTVSLKVAWMSSCDEFRNKLQKSNTSNSEADAELTFL